MKLDKSEYYSELFTKLNKHILEFYSITDNKVYDNTESTFPLVIMRRQEVEEGYSWFLTHNQISYLSTKERLIKLSKLIGYNSVIKFLENWLKFKFINSGFINYFIKSNKQIEILKNIEEQIFLIGEEAYEKDYNLNINNNLLLEKEKLNQNGGKIDPFSEIESFWNFKEKNYPFYYFKIKTNSDVDFIGLLPLYNISLKPHILSLILFIQNTVFGASLMNETMQQSILDVKKHSIKSAKAAIMARNISHNLGSHVIYYIKSAILSFEDIHTYPHLAEFSKKGDDIIFPKHIYRELKENIKGIKKEEREIKAPFLRGLIRFLNYLQERHDYIATISNSHIPYSGSVNFKDVVFDIIIPDSKIERHKKNEKELIKYKEQNLLLDFIAKSEKLNRKLIKIYYKTYGEPGKFIPTKAENKYEEELRKKENSESHLKYLRDIELSLPSGIMGRQAFFSIFENFIRNTAKHSQSKENNILEIVFCVNKEGDYYEFMLYDAKNVTTKTDFKNKIYEALKDKYTKDDGELNQANKGIKEMRISAAWLRGLQVENIENEQNLELKIGGGKLLDAFLIDPETFGESADKKINDVKDEDLEKGALCYVFKVPISKKMVVVTSKEIQVENEDPQFNMVSPEKYLDGSFLKNYKLTVVDSELYNDEYVVDGRSKKFNNLINNTPARTLTTNLNNVNTVNDKTYLDLYKKWINDFINFDRKSFLDFNILIEDKDNPENQQNASRKIITSTGLDADTWKYNLQTPSIIYRTHNDTEEKFELFKKTNQGVFNNPNTHFIEGISGHNSTERLLRHEELNEEWRFKMLESALTKITIVDERIYDNYKTETAERKQISAGELKKHTDSLEDFEQFIEKNYTDHINIKKKKFYNKIVKNIESKIKHNNDSYSEIINGWIDIAVLDLNKTQKNNVKHSILDKKNISIYNLEKNESDDLVLYALNQEHKILNFNSVLSKSHFVLVHQGVLEKLKTNEEEEIDVTLGKFQDLFPVYSNGKYIVHSGRSIPNNLPKGVGFAQFSSVEAALEDCKFSLSELAFNAIIEKPNN